jgi:hypothetical protein
MVVSIIFEHVQWREMGTYNDRLARGYRLAGTFSAALMSPLYGRAVDVYGRAANSGGAGPVACRSHRIPARFPLKLHGI